MRCFHWLQPAIELGQSVVLVPKRIQAKPNDLKMIDKRALVHSLNLRPRHGARLGFIIPREVDVIGLGNTHGW